MTSRKKTWREQLADKQDLPKVLKLERRFPCFNALHKMGVGVGEEVVLVNPSEVLACMEKVARGRLVTIVEICRQIANKHRVKGCCSLTTSIFIMAAAQAVEEARKAGTELGIPEAWKENALHTQRPPGGR
jgi:hypothetical protein